MTTTVITSKMVAKVTVEQDNANHEYSLEITRETSCMWTFTDPCTRMDFSGAIREVLYKAEKARAVKFAARLDEMLAALAKVDRILPVTGTTCHLDDDSGKACLTFTCIHGGDDPVWSMTMHRLPLWLSRPVLVGGMRQAIEYIDGLKSNLPASPDLTEAFKAFESKM